MRRRARLWLRGWWVFWLAVRQVRCKRHGVGAQPWPITLWLAGCARYIAYGQHYPTSRSFRWMRSRMSVGAALLAVLLLAGGCAHNASNCAGWEAILLSKQDQLTRETEERILAHNRQGERQGCWSAPR